MIICKRLDPQIFLADGTGQTGPTKVVQEVLADLKTFVLDNVILSRYGAVFGLVTAAILFKHLDSGTRQVMAVAPS